LDGFKPYILPEGRGLTKSFQLDPKCLEAEVHAANSILPEPVQEHEEMLN
jgi:hypothetical protein